jgi:hypothetical protein
LDQRFQHGAVIRVADFGPVERHCGDTALVGLKQDNRVGHDAPLRTYLMKFAQTLAWRKRSTGHRISPNRRRCRRLRRASLVADPVRAVNRHGGWLALCAGCEIAAPEAFIEQTARGLNPETFQ